MQPYVLQKALSCCLGTVEAFAPSRITEHLAQTSSPIACTEWLKNMETLGKSVDKRVFKLLRMLAKTEEDETRKDSNSNVGTTRFKDIYRSSLRVKTTLSNAAGPGGDDDTSIVERLRVVYEILGTIQNTYDDTGDCAPK